MTNPVRCLVTGGAGFIGSHVAEKLVALGYQVRVLDNLSTGSVENLAHLPSVELQVDDLRDEAACHTATRDVDLVFHLAALGSVPRSMKEPWNTHDNNVNGTVRLLEASRANGVRRVVYSSSSSVYGDTPVLPKHEGMEILPRSPYAASKLAGEQYVLSYARAGLIEGVALRYFNVFGPRQSPVSAYAAVIPLYMRAALEGSTALVFGDGLQTRDFTYVDNVVEANLRAALQPADRVSGNAYNVGAGDRTSLLDLVAKIERVAGRPLNVEHKDPRSGDVRDSLASLARTGPALDYTPVATLDVGLARTWAWFEQSERALAVQGA